MKKLQIITLSIGLFFIASIANAQFQVAWSYRIKSKATPTNYLTFHADTANSNEIFTSSYNTATNTVFLVEDNATNLGKYNIFTGDGVRLFVFHTGDDVRSKADLNKIDFPEAVFEILQLTPADDDYSLGISYDFGEGAGFEPQYLIADKDPAFTLSTANNTDKNRAKWIFEYVGTLGIEDRIKQSSNDVYPVPSTDGVFNLKEKAAWSVYAINGVLIGEGNGTIIDISNAPNGLYILRFNGISRKIIF